MRSRSDSRTDDEIISSNRDEEDTIVRNDWVGASLFPFFDDDRNLLHYKRSALAKNDSSRLLVVVLLFATTFATRSNLSCADTYGPFFICGMTSAIASFTLFILIYIPKIFVELYRNRSNTVIFIYARKILNSRLGVIVEQLVPIAISLSVGFYLYARVVAGQCHDKKNLWAGQSCNPYAEDLSIPHDQTILCFLSPTISQLLVKGARFQIILLSWAISTIFVVVSIVHVSGWPELWTALYSLLFLCITVEVERLMRFSYGQNEELTYCESKRSDLAIAVLRRTHTYAIKKVSMLLHPCLCHCYVRTVWHACNMKRIKYKIYFISLSLYKTTILFISMILITILRTIIWMYLQVKYELQIVSQQAKKDKNEIESERARLRGLIGNVAHDIKIPLKSIGE